MNADPDQTTPWEHDRRQTKALESIRATLLVIAFLLMSLLGLLLVTVGSSM